MAGERTERTIPWGAILGAAALLAFAALLAKGVGYYRLPLDERSSHALHRVLRPSGSTGHPYGWIGTAVILSNLLYLARRRFARTRALGSMRGWLRWHVASGLVGPALVVLHSALTLRTAPAMAASFALAVLVVTGVVGRYLYALVPRGSDGAARSAEEVRGDLDRSLMEMRALGEGGIRAADALDAAAERVLARLASREGARAVLATLRARTQLRRLPRIAVGEAARAGADGREIDRVARIAEGLVMLELRADGRLVRTAASSWRDLHRFFAFVMVLSAALHVTVLFYLGYGL